VGDRPLVGSAALDSAVVSELGVVDGEGGVSMVGRRVLPGTDDVQLVGKMVEGASHIVDTFANPDVPFIRYLADLFNADTDPPIAVTIGAGFYEVRYGPTFLKPRQ